MKKIWGASCSPILAFFKLKFNLCENFEKICIANQTQNFVLCFQALFDSSYLVNEIDLSMCVR